ALVDALQSLEVHDHLALIYETQEEQFDAALPFIATGLAADEKCIYITDDNAAEEVIDAAAAHGIDVEGAFARGDLEVTDPSETYLREGYFDPDEMFEFLRDAVAQAKSEGYSALRATGEMTWQLGGDIGTDKLLEYEARLNDFLAEHDCLAICQYNYERFSPEVLKEVVQTHPNLVYGYTVADNFYYVPPEEYLNPDPEKDLERWLSNVLERERIERDLQDREEQLNVLTTVLRHQLRNDVNVIQGEAAALEDELTGDERDRAAKIVEVGERLTKLGDKAATAENILASESEIRTLDLTELIAAQIEAFRERFPEVTFRFDAAVDDVEVLCAEKFGMASKEVIENAAVYNEADPRVVEVSITVGDDGAVDLEVADNGPGISAMNVDTLTGDREIQPVFHGSGVGLWIAHWVVTRSRGELEFRDNDPRGSVVTIRLPNAEGIVR
ncbi:MAG: MEDS domain-containing protein, partial [Haloquadratum sp.]